MPPIFVQMANIDDTVYVSTSGLGLVTGWRDLDDARAFYVASHESMIADKGVADVVKLGLKCGNYYSAMRLRLVRVLESDLDAIIALPFNVEKLETPFGEFIGIPLFKDARRARRLWDNGITVRFDPANMLWSLLTDSEWRQFNVALTA